MNRPLVYVTRRLAVDPAVVLGPEFDVAVWPGERAPTRAELLEGARHAAGLVTLLSDPIDDALFAQLPALRVVANYAVGYDNVDVKAAAARGIAVSNTPDVLTDATADLAFTLLLMVARRAGEGERQLRSGGWTGWRPTHMLGTQVTGKTVGMIGMGRIARAVAHRAHHGFGMKVIFHDPYPPTPEQARALGAEPRDSLEAVLREADFVSLYCPATPETRHLMNRERFALMRPEAYLVNTARGDVVDEAVKTLI
jgi:lactate dehydrogenase-like 2-hydroxyacid dehydrogenase